MANPGRPKATDEAIDKLAALKRLELEDAIKDNRLGSSLGRLYRGDKITAVEFMAGEGFQALVASYRLVKGLPNGRAKPNQLQPKIPGGQEFDYDPNYVREIEDRYDEIFVAVNTMHGHKCMKIVNQVCIDDEWCELYNRDQLRAGLRTIAQKLRL